MNKEEILELFKKHYDGREYYEYRLRAYDLEGIIETILTKHKLELAESEAKVYTYENIIANSNFKAVNNKSIDSLNKKIKELENELEILKGDSNE